MKVSVIVPVFNVYRWVGEFLFSINSQIKIQKDYEIILIDDGSVDGTMELCENYARTNSHLKLIKSNHKGVSAARNIGLQHSMGQYIVFLDADDKISPNYINRMLKLIESDDDVDMVCCGYSSNELDLGKYYKSENILYRESAQIFFSKMLSGDNKYWYNGYLWNKIFKSEIIKSNNIIFSDNIVLWEDMLFVEQYLKFCNKVMFSNEILYFYRMRRDSVSNSNQNIEKIKSMLNVSFKIYKLADGNSSLKKDAFRLMMVNYIYIVKKKIKGWLFFTKITKG